MNPERQIGSPEFRFRAGVAAARLYRRRLRRVTFVGVTGSAGKTTTKELIASVLAHAGRVRRSPADANGLSVIAKTILRTTPRDAYCVAEVAAASEPGMVALGTALLRPDVGVVTTVGRDHRAVFRSLEAMAQEKQALVTGLPPHGTAILNADDENVLRMADGFAGRVITFGESPAALVRAQDVESAWPEPLCLTASFGGHALPVRTRLHGRHWITSVLAAMAVAQAVGLELSAAAAALAEVNPVPHRMQPVRVGEATFVDDAEKAPHWALSRTFDFLASAKAPRRILVIGTLSDYSNPASTVYRQTADRALEVAEEVIFVGDNARLGRSHSPRAADHLRGFAQVADAAEHLRRHIQPGDLIVLKGSKDFDGLDRLIRLV